MSKAFNIILISLCSLSAKLLVVTAAGLRATAIRTTIRKIKDLDHHVLHHATADQKTEVLRLTDDDNIAFFKDEIERGYLGRKDFDQALFASQLADDDDFVLEDDDQYRDHETGGFIFDSVDPAEDL